MHLSPTAVLTVLLLVVTPCAGSTPRFRLTLLPNLPGTAGTGAASISEHGWIVGQTNVPTESGPHGVLWTDPSLPPLLVQGPGADFSFAHDVNSQGKVVGQTGEGFSGFRWSPGSEMVLLTPLCCSDATAISDRGVVVGFSGSHAVVWNEVGVHPLPHLPGAVQSEAHDVNERGRVAGSSGGAAVLWDNSIAIEIGAVGDLANLAVGLNDVGDVVGFGYHSEPAGAVIAFHWRDGRRMVLPTLGGVQTRAEAVNDNGWIVGMSDVLIGSFQGDPRAAIWIDGQVHDLNTLVVNPEPGLPLRHALGINNNGQIVGNAFGGGEGRVFLLDPITPADLNGDGLVNGIDLGILLAAWGACLPPSPGEGERGGPAAKVCSADLDHDGIIHGVDLAMLLAAWGQH